ncbi:hypothetical protein QR721_03625 [Aciduricibacillus chroicocephali]|uniref:Uncharacterized protein n=1 Tax=Aciduricibacillus chroicocephali TaxID=3054939 RepID=A0ABY9KXF0_9BACI|nr:hypothetical protein QR721_03625 [Bacillaceae bacterium 44XB]
MYNCPTPNPQSCCQKVIEFKTQLVPPALPGSVVTKLTFPKPVIEDVCPEKVIVCGKLIKTITYTAVKSDGTKETKTITDERSFQCVIDREDANEGDEFEVVGYSVLCEGKPILMNKGVRHNKDVFWRLKEKDIVKICIRKKWK